MSDRALVHVTEEDDDLGVTYHLVISRSPLGPPGGFVTIARTEDGNDSEELTITVPDLTVLGRVVNWAHG